MGSGSKAAAIRHIAVRVATWAALLLVVATLVIVSGLIPVNASSGHWPITAWLLHFAMQRSVATHSLGIQAPKLDDRRLVLLGAGHYEGGCRFCHGAPGTLMPAIPQAGTPHPPRLGSHMDDYDDPELFYIVKHGIKFTGMPAWPARQREDEVWAVVAFLRVLPDLDGEGYRRLVYGEDELYAAEAPRVVRERCARCHGAHGLGRREGAFPRLAGQRAQYLKETMQAYAKGERFSGIMQPIAARLDASELRDAVVWYATRPPAPAPQLGAEVKIEELLERRVPLCTVCHGDAAAHPSFPRLTGQYPVYLEQQLTLFREQQRGGGPYLELMQTVAHWLRAEEVPKLARFVAAAGNAP